MPEYRGYPEGVGGGDPLVTKDGAPLSPARSQKIVNHSPDGFSWGYGGSGPSRLALALLLEEFPKDEALELYQDFKWEVVARWPMYQPWAISSEEILDRVKTLRHVGEGP